MHYNPDGASLSRCGRCYYHYTADLRMVTCQRCQAALVKDMLVRAQAVKDDAQALGIPLVVEVPLRGADGEGRGRR